MLSLMTVFAQLLQTRRSTEILGESPCLESHRWKNSRAQHRTLLESWFHSELQWSKHHSMNIDSTIGPGSKSVGVLGFGRDMGRRRKLTL